MEINLKCPLNGVNNKEVNDNKRINQSIEDCVWHTCTYGHGSRRIFLQEVETQKPELQPPWYSLFVYVCLSALEILLLTYLRLDNQEPVLLYSTL